MTEPRKQLIAPKGQAVEAYGDVRVVAMSGSLVFAGRESSVKAQKGSIVVASKGSRVVAEEFSIVVNKGGAILEAQPTTLVIYAYDQARHKKYRYVFAHKDSSFADDTVAIVFPGVEIKAGRGCYVAAMSNTIVDVADNSKVVSADGCVVKTGNNCRIKFGARSSIYPGFNCLLDGSTAGTSLEPQRWRRSKQV